MKLPTHNPTVSPEEELPKVQEMLYKHAWEFSRQYPVSYEVCLGIAYEAFILACYDYQADRGAKFSTWCYFSVWTRLKDMVMKASAEPLEFFSELTDMETGYNQFVQNSPYHFKEMVEDVMHDIQSEAQEVLSMFLEVPKEIIAEVNTPTRLVRYVKRKFLEQKGRTAEDFDSAMQAIQLRLQMEWND